MHDREQPCTQVSARCEAMLFGQREKQGFLKQILSRGSIGCEASRVPAQIRQVLSTGIAKAGAPITLRRKSHSRRSYRNNGPNRPERRTALSSRRLSRMREPRLRPCILNDLFDALEGGKTRCRDLRWRHLPAVKRKHVRNNGHAVTFFSRARLAAQMPATPKGIAKLRVGAGRTSLSVVQCGSLITAITRLPRPPQR